MSQYSRIQQLQRTITELRMRGLEERVEIRQLRNHVEEQKTALEAAQLEIEALTRDIYAIHRANENAHRYAASLNDLLDARDTALAIHERESYREPAECSDYRQYESLAVQAAFARTRTRQ